MPAQRTATFSSPPHRRQDRKPALARALPRPTSALHVYCSNTCKPAQRPFEADRRSSVALVLVGRTSRAAEDKGERSADHVACEGKNGGEAAACGSWRSVRSATICIKASGGKHHGASASVLGGTPVPLTAAASGAGSGSGGVASGCSIGLLACVRGVLACADSKRG